MTQGVLERVERESPQEAERLAERHAYQEALKAYFHAVSSLGNTDDLQFVENLVPQVDFIFRVAPERVVPVNDQLLDLAYDLRTKYGANISTVVLPKLPA